MVKEVMRLDDRHSAAMYKLIARSHTHGAATLNVLAFRDYFLNDRDGVALACLDGDRIEQLFLSGVEDSNTMVTKNMYGTFGEHTLDILDQLCAICASRTPPIVEHAFLISDQTHYGFHEAFKSCRLSKFAVEQSETILPAGVRPTDKFIWEKALSKNVPAERLHIFRVKIEYPTE